MERKQKIMLGSAIFTMLLCILPVSVYAESVSVPSMNYAQVTLPSGSSSGTWSSTASITAFIASSYAGIVIYTQAGTSGSWSESYSSSTTYYIWFVNANYQSVTVTYTISGGGIPGFLFLYTLFALLAVFGIVALKKRTLV